MEETVTDRNESDATRRMARTIDSAFWTDVFVKLQKKSNTIGTMFCIYFNKPFVYGNLDKIDRHQDVTFQIENVT